MTAKVLLRRGLAGGTSNLQAVVTGGTWNFEGDLGVFFGSAGIVVTGGVPPYTYDWNPSGDASVMFEIPGGASFSSPSGSDTDVNCTVTDNNGASVVSNTSTITL